MSAPSPKRRKYSRQHNETRIKVSTKPSLANNEHLVSSLPAYEYQPLSKKDEIRVLKVKRVGASKWSYHIEHTTLDEAPLFETISYVWGPDTRRHILYVNGNTILRINDNLNDALPYLSAQCTTGYLWIDQVCINQSSAQERNHQVRIMGNIYRRGERVLAWLGVGRPFSASMLELIRVARRSLELKETLPLLKEKLAGQLVQGDTHLFEGVRQLLENDWFSRAWVFQEIVLSGQATLVMGHVTIPFLALAWIARVAGSYLMSPPADPALGSPTRQVFSPARRAWHTTIKETHGYQILSVMHWSWTMISLNLGFDRMPFTHLLSTTSPISKTTDPRDSVYAFLGLQLNPSITIEPSYSSTYEEVLLETAISIIRGSGSLDILAYCCRKRSLEDLCTPLPSWVPDWRAPLASPLLLRSWHSGQFRWTTKAHSWVESEYHRELRVRGRCVDTILRTFEPAFRYQAENWYEEDLREYLALDERLKSVQNFTTCTRAILFEAIMALAFCPDIEYRDFDTPSYTSSIEGFLDAYDEYVGARNEGRNLVESKRLRGLRYHTYLANTRHLFQTRDGHLGLVSRPCEDAIICILEGCSTFVVLEPCGRNRFTVVGNCHFRAGPWTNRTIGLWWGDKEVEAEVEEFILVYEPVRRECSQSRSSAPTNSQ